MKMKIYAIPLTEIYFFKKKILISFFTYHAGDGNNIVQADSQLVEKSNKIYFSFVLDVFAWLNKVI